MNSMLLCYIISVYARLIESVHLETNSYVDQAAELDENRSALWISSVSTSTKIDFKYMQICDTGEFARLSAILVDYFSPHTVANKFEWTSVSLARINSPKHSYILLGGSTPRNHTKESASPRTGNMVILCQLEGPNVPGQKTSRIRLSVDPCVSLSTTSSKLSGHEYLGASSSSLNFNDTTAVFTYCDPLWRPDPKISIGRCFLHLMQGTLSQHDVREASFCESGDAGGTRCGAGFSAMLSTTSDVQSSLSVAGNEKLSNLHLWVGQPLFESKGRVQIVSDPFDKKNLITINNPGKMIGTGFGYALTDGFVTAPGFGQTELNSDIDYAKLVGVYLSASSGKYYGTINWLAKPIKSDPFSGYGHSLVRFHLNNVVGVVVGAPYASLNNRQGNNNITERLLVSGMKNRGRIYLHCRSNTDSRDYFSKDTVHLQDDYIDGPPGRVYFGYSLSNIGNSYDSGGAHLIAVGAPDLDGHLGRSYIYLVRILPVCRFDTRPLQVIEGPPGATDFGANLPAKSEDLDFNNWHDLVVPFAPRYATKTIPSPLTLLGRPFIQTKCNFEFAPWLSVQKLQENDIIPVEIRIFFHTTNSQESNAYIINEYLRSLDVSSLNHQVNPDWNATSSDAQRFQLDGVVNGQLNHEQKFMRVSFRLTSKKKVEDITLPDSLDNGIFVGYRFMATCIKDPDVCSLCPLVDWSQCVSRIPIMRFACYPRDACISDVSMKIRDGLTKRLVFSPKQAKLKGIQEQTVSEANTDNSQSNATLELTFGVQSDLLPEIEIEVFNFGPTMAGGVWLEMQFTGNLRFAQLEVVNSSLTYQLPLTLTSNNETWAVCGLNDIPGPIVDETDQVQPVWTLKLTMYYNISRPIEKTDFTLGAGVKIRLNTGTPDPDHSDNSLILNYQTVNKPKIRVSRGPKMPSAHVENRSEPLSQIPSYQRRIELSDLGPRVHYTFQAEYLGPMPFLKNVAFHISVPTQLAKPDRGRRKDLYLLYLLREVRATGRDWIDLVPKITGYNEVTQKSEIMGTCVFKNEKDGVNPRGLVGVDSSSSNIRYKRNAMTFKENKLESEANLNSPLNSSSSNTHYLNKQSHTFRRTPKEILQCDRVGYLLGKPTCTEIVCHVDILRANRPVTVTVTAWLWIRTMFAKHISDVDLVSTLSVDQGQIPLGIIPAKEPVAYFHLPQTFFFPQIRPKILQQIPIWPIVVGVVVGVVFLALLVILLYVLGFFKRRKPALRKAKWSRGGAEETERQSQLTNNEDVGKSQHQAKRAKIEDDRYGKRKTREKMEIIHPSDLVHDKDQQEAQGLLDTDSG